MSLFKDAASLAKALAIQIAVGMPMASKEEQLERHQICGQCPLLSETEYRCTVCNCWLDYKVPLRTSVCPKGQWPDLMSKGNDNENKNL